MRKTLEKSVPATGLTVSKTELHLIPNGYQMLSVTATPADTSVGTITWNSSDETVATVDSTGKVTAVADGTSTITVTNGTLSAECAVKVSAYGELLVGGDFSENNIAWGCKDAEEQESNQSGVYEGIGENGTNGFRLLTTGENYYKGPAIVLIPNNSYKLSIRYKSSVTTKRVHELCFFGGCGAFWLEGTKGEWTTIEKIFKAPATFKKSDY